MCPAPNALLASLLLAPKNKGSFPAVLRANPGAAWRILSYVGSSVRVVPANANLLDPRADADMEGADAAPAPTTTRIVTRPIPRVYVDRSALSLLPYVRVLSKDFQDVVSVLAQDNWNGGAADFLSSLCRYEGVDLPWIVKLRAASVHPSARSTLPPLVDTIRSAVRALESSCERCGATSVYTHLHLVTHQSVCLDCALCDPSLVLITQRAANAGHDNRQAHRSLWGRR